MRGEDTLPTVGSQRSLQLNGKRESLGDYVDYSVLVPTTTLLVP